MTLFYDRWTKMEDEKLLEEYKFDQDDFIRQDK